MNIEVLKGFDFPREVIAAANGIASENHDVNKHNALRKHHSGDLEADKRVATKLMRLIVHDTDRYGLDWVYFSCPNGVVEHTDDLDNTFDTFTHVLPVIIPIGGAVLTVEGDADILKHGFMYRFNHQLPHSLFIQNAPQPCVVLMATLKKLLSHEW